MNALQLFKYTFFFLSTISFENSPHPIAYYFPPKNASNNPIPGTERTKLYLPLLQNKKIGIIANQSSRVKDQHLVDFLLDSSIQIVRIFSPEHGFRGTADAGENIEHAKDLKTGIPIISLYGKNKKPDAEQLKDIDVMIFDLQDVGVRFYTYISTLTYVMEACAQQDIPLIILDRPNPNGHYIDGPTLKSEFRSFVGLHPVPVVYGMTIAEYARMVYGEGWMTPNIFPLKLKVIPLKNYDRKMLYTLPINPSPNLPNDQSINLYPSLCFFEGTQISIGRGTEFPFQIYGAPYFDRRIYPFTFTPKPKSRGKKPKFNGKNCYGEDLGMYPKLNRLNLNWLINAYGEAVRSGTKFFTPFFKKLAGNELLQQQIEQAFSEEQIRASWKRELETFKKIRGKYLLYPDF